MTRTRPKLRAAAVLTLALIASVSTVAARQGAARAALDTWIEQLNEAPMEALQRHVAGAFADSFLQQVPLDQMMAVHRQLKAVAPFAIDSIESEADRTVVALLRSAAGTLFRARLSVSGEPPKVDGLLIQPVQDAAAEPPAPLQWDTLDELAQALVDDAGLPGVAIGWARLGGEPEVGVAGVRAVDGDDPIEPGDLFHIGSLTKSFTATVLAALVEQGALGWHDALGELLPEIPMDEVYAGVELQRLLRHRGRVPQHQTMSDDEMARLNALPGTPTEQRRAYVAEVLALAPLDEGYHYSNAGYAVAGYAGEHASGRSWEQLVREEVFEPLGLASCGLGWPATADRPDEPRGHFGVGAAHRVQGLDEYPLGAFIAPAGNVHCDVADLTRYGLAHLAGLSGQDGFLRATTIGELHRLEPDGAPYAAGWGVDPESGQHRHNGSAGTFYAYLTIDPGARIVVAFFTNVGPAEGQPAGARAAAAILERFAGR